MTMTDARAGYIAAIGSGLGVVLQLLAVALTVWHTGDNGLILSIQSVLLVITVLTLWRARSMMAEHIEKIGRYAAERKMSEIMLEKMRDATLTTATVEADVEDDDTPPGRRH
jgi:hypothetical protein